jgi:thioredoxin reductase (NADPH)
VLYTGKDPGGQLMITNDVENFPGYPDSIMGPQLMEDLKRQAERFGTEIRYEMIVRVDFSGKIHKVYNEEGTEIQAHTVIVCTGASAKWLGLESEHRLWNKGVSACAVCDGFFFRKKPVIVVGGGDTAAEEATYLAKLCTEVHLIVRRDVLRASKIMQQRVLGVDDVMGAKVRNNKTGEIAEIAAKGFFVAIGHEPNTAMFKGILEMDETGYLKAKAGSTRTNIKGVFVAGDAQDKVYRQAVTAAGTGCMAALDAERYLAARNIH